jgi:hypothetical protein
VIAPVIPILADAGCAGRVRPRYAEPALEGDPVRIGSLVQALQERVSRELGHELPVRAWLRGLSLGEGEVRLQLAPDLACHGLAIASLAFDLLRARLADTDIFVGEAPA